MNANRRIQPTPENVPLLRWIFERDARTLTCELDVSGKRDFDVCVVPHWNVSSSLIEHFNAPTGALVRHAEIARRLREDGWTLTGHMRADRAATAA